MQNKCKQKFGTVEVRVSNFDINCLNRVVKAASKAVDHRLPPEENELRADINLVVRMVQDFKDAFRRQENENNFI